MLVTSLPPVSTHEEKIASFARDGYFVEPNMFDAEACAIVIDSYLSTVKQSTLALPRFKAASPERHEFDENGRVCNPLLRVHAMEDASLDGFSAACRAIVQSEPMNEWFARLLGGPGAIAETFFFETNNATELHRDSDYVPDVPAVVGAWIALEDIDADAGRFFVYARSQRRWARNVMDPIALGAQYFEGLRSEVREAGDVCAAPALARGDVVFFDGSAIHGSLESARSARTRFSLTAHAVHASALELVQAKRLLG